MISRIEPVCFRALVNIVKINGPRRESSGFFYCLFQPGDRPPLIFRKEGPYDLVLVVRNPTCETLSQPRQQCHIMADRV